MAIDKSLFSSMSGNWATPDQLYRELDYEFNFDYDPCPLADKPAIDGLLTEWGDRTYCNPPYNRYKITSWILKAIEESQKGKTVVMLLPVRTCTEWFHELVLKHSSDIRFIKGRLTFKGGKSNAPFPSMIVVFDKK